jgi:hypothetical protein
MMDDQQKRRSSDSAGKKGEMKVPCAQNLFTPACSLTEPTLKTRDSTLGSQLHGMIRAQTTGAKETGNES